jgi:hypothetical protein
MNKFNVIWSWYRDLRTQSHIRFERPNNIVITLDIGDFVGVRGSDGGPGQDPAVIELTRRQANMLSRRLTQALERTKQ